MDKLKFSEILWLGWVFVNKVIFVYLFYLFFFLRGIYDVDMLVIDESYFEIKLLIGKWGLYRD